MKIRQIIFSSSLYLLAFVLLHQLIVGNVTRVAEFSLVYEHDLPDATFLIQTLVKETRSQCLLTCTKNINCDSVGEEVAKIFEQTE